MNFIIEADTQVNDSSYSWITLYSRSNNRNDQVYNVSLEKSLGNGGSLTFTMPHTHTAYNQIMILGTTIRVSVISMNKRINVVWVGRIISISTGEYLDKTVSCEGGLAWLGDIIARPELFLEPATFLDENEHLVSVLIERNGTPSEYLTYISSQYIRWRSPKRPVRLAWMTFGVNLFGSDDSTGTFVEQRIIQGNGDYKSCLDALNDLVSIDPNAVLYVHYEDEASIVVDIINIVKFKSTWDAEATLNYHNTVSGRANLISSDDDISGDGIYTSIIPLAKDKKTLETAWDGANADFVRSMNYGVYGVIEKAQDFSSVDIMEPYTTSALVPSDAKPGEQQQLVTVTKYRKNYTELIRRANEELSKIEGTVKLLNVEAVDLSMIDTTKVFVDIGTKVSVTDPVHNITGMYIVSSLSLDLDNPGAGRYTLYPCGQGYKTNKQTLLSDIVSKGPNTNVTEFADTESPLYFKKIDDYHVQAIGQNWNEDYDIQDTGNREYIASVKRYKNAGDQS